MWNILACVSSAGETITVIAARETKRGRALGFILCIATKSATKTLQSQKSLDCRNHRPLLIRCRKQASVFRVPDYLFKIHSRLDAHVFSSLLCRRRADVGRLGTFIRAFQTPDVAFNMDGLSGTLARVAVIGRNCTNL